MQEFINKSVTSQLLVKFLTEVFTAVFVLYDYWIMAELSELMRKDILFKIHICFVNCGHHIEHSVVYIFLTKFSFLIIESVISYTEP